MSILLKLHYANFQRKTFGGSARPPLVQEGLKLNLKY